jgi:Family of unknown function (DUF6263)
MKLNRFSCLSYLITAFTVVFFSACHHSGKSYLIKSPSQASARYNYQVKQTVTVGMFGVGKSTDQSLQMVLSLKQEANSQWTAKLEQLSYSTDLGDKQFKFDSKKKADSDSSLLNTLLSTCDNRAYHFTILPDGSISKVVCTDSLCYPVTAKGDSLERYMTMQIAQGIFGENAITEVISELIGYTSDKPMEQSGMQKTRTSLVPFPVVRDETYKVDKLENGMYFMKLTAKLHPQNDKGIIELAGKQITYDFKGEEEGDMQIDEKSGLLKSANYTRKMDGSISMEEMKGMMSAVKPNMSIKRSATITKL